MQNAKNAKKKCSLLLNQQQLMIFMHCGCRGLTESVLMEGHDPRHNQTS